jgi:P27 family predicted phage terminase small subunit
MPNPRKPTALRVLEGNRAHRPPNAREPKPEPKVPSCPGSLSAEARKIWRRLAPQLHARGLLTDWDRETFGLYCEAVAQHYRALQLIEPALLVKGRRDGLITNPAWRIYRDSAALVRAFAQEFGLTPAARSGIEVPEVVQDDTGVFTPVRIHGS